MHVFSKLDVSYFAAPAGKEDWEHHSPFLSSSFCSVSSGAVRRCRQTRSTLSLSGLGLGEREGAKWARRMGDRDEKDATFHPDCGSPRLLHMPRCFNWSLKKKGTCKPKKKEGPVGISDEKKKDRGKITRLKTRKQGKKDIVGSTL